jgi:hypothetical protein
MHKYSYIRGIIEKEEYIPKAIIDIDFVYE